MNFYVALLTFFHCFLYLFAALNLQSPLRKRPVIRLKAATTGRTLVRPKILALSKCVYRRHFWLVGPMRE